MAPASASPKGAGQRVAEGLELQALAEPGRQAGAGVGAGPRTAAGE